MCVIKLRLERDKRHRLQRENALGEEKLAALSEHIEKLMVALRLEAQGKLKQRGDHKGLTKKYRFFQSHCCWTLQLTRVANNNVGSSHSANKLH